MIKIKGFEIEVDLDKLPSKAKAVYLADPEFFARKYVASLNQVLAKYKMKARIVETDLTISRPIVNI
jgi:hypothetical protein